MTRRRAPWHSQTAWVVASFLAVAVAGAALGWQRQPNLWPDPPGHPVTTTEETAWPSPSPTTSPSIPRSSSPMAAGPGPTIMRTVTPPTPRRASSTTRVSSTVTSTAGPLVPSTTTTTPPDPTTTLAPTTITRRTATIPTTTMEVAP